MTKKAIIFDLDGTLWDSSRQITDSWNEVLQEMGREACSYEFITSLLGQPMDVFAREIFPDLPLEKGLEELQKCMEYENAYLEKHGATLYPDLRETVEKLRNNGYFTAVVSNSQSGYIEAFMKAHQLEDLFDDIECFGNTCYKDENIRRVIERNGIDEAVYVGDIQSDCDASTKAGIPFIFASYGFGNVDTDRRIDSLRELPEAADRIFDEVFAASK